MNLAIRTLAVVLLGTALIAQAATQSPPLALDRARSQAGFSVWVLWLWPLRGQFEDFDGKVTLDAATGLARVEARIKAASVSMRNADYADWARSAEFFAAAEHPDIHFLSEPFEPALLSRGGDLPGMLQLRGVSRAARFSVRGADCDAWRDAHCAVEVRGHVRRSDYGMSTRRSTLSDRVWLRFTLYLADT